MATGWPDHELPDLNADVDVVAQTLAEQNIRYRNGDVSVYGAQQTVNAGLTGSIVTLTMRGMVYSVLFHVNQPGAQYTDVPQLVIDGSINFNLRIVDYQLVRADLLVLAGPVLRLNDTVNHDFLIHFPFEQSFDTTFGIQYDNNGAGNVVCTIMVAYAES